MSGSNVTSPSKLETDRPDKPPLMDTSGPAQQSHAVVLSTPESHPVRWVKRWRLAILAIAIGTVSLPLSLWQPSKIPIDPHDYTARTKHVLSTTPLIDGHNDLPYIIRIELYGKMYDGGFNLNDKLLGHTDIQRMRKGQMGGQFWSVFVDCEEAAGIDDPTVSVII
jgi:membrane dipeptidase